MKKKVLVDVFYLCAATTGVRTYVTEFLKAAEQSEKYQYRSFPDPERMLRLDVFRGKYNFFWKVLFHFSYLFYKQVILPFYAFLIGADVLFCPDYYAPFLFRKRLKLVVIHDAFFWQHPENYNERWRKYFIQQITLGLSSNTKIITTSHHAEACLREYLKTEIPMHVVYQSSERLLDMQVAPNQDILSKLDLEPGQYFLHLGYFDKRKNLVTLVDGFASFLKQVPDASMKLVLVGGQGINDHLNDYHNVMTRIQLHRLEDKVLMPGHLPDEEVGALYEQAFMYVFPSYSEGFGIPALEAMSKNIPVIVSDEGALSEITGDAAMVFRAMNSEDLADKIRKLYEDQHTYQELQRRGKQRFEFFSRTRFLTQVEEIIDGK